MKKYINKLLAATALSGLCLYSSASMSEDFRIDDFRFAMNDPSFSTWNGAGGAQPVGNGPYGTLIEGTYQGTNATNVLVDFVFFGNPVHVYTSDTNQGSANSAAGSISGGPVPTIDLATSTADLSSWFAEWNGTEFNQGNNSNFAACSGNSLAGDLSPTATVTDNLDGTYAINWNSCITGGAFNSQIGYWRLNVTCTTCPPSILGAADSLIATQGANVTRTVIQGAGNVVITSSFGAAPTGFGGAWTNSGTITDIDGDFGTFTFDPSAVDPGLYKFTYTYQNNTTTPTTKGTGSILLKVVASASVDVLDTDNDGIINEVDDSALTATQLQGETGNSQTYVMQSSVGNLVLGQVAFCSDNNAARVSMADIADYSGDLCTATSNTDDALIKNVGEGGFYDFEVHSLDLGSSADIVIPLTAPIPANATYRKYTATSGWELFAVGNGDALASAPATSTGICPASTSSTYVTGLNQGDTCLRLTITDGGLNDADSSANGIIKDPGGIAQIESGVDATLRGNGCSMTTHAKAKDHAEWFLVAGFIALLGWFKLSRRKA